MNIAKSILLTALFAVSCHVSANGGATIGTLCIDHVCSGGLSVSGEVVLDPINTEINHIGLPLRDAEDVMPFPSVPSGAGTWRPGLSPTQVDDANVCRTSAEGGTLCSLFNEDNRLSVGKIR